MRTRILFCGLLLTATFGLSSLGHAQGKILDTLYPPLVSALRQGQWQQANRLTSLAILQLAGQERRGYLVSSDTMALPCDDLLNIDFLWSAASGGKFGFSKQRELWRQIGGKNYPDSMIFERMVGWHPDVRVFNLRQAAAGHLPYRPVLSEGYLDAWGGGWIEALSARLEQCGVQ